MFDYEQDLKDKYKRAKLSLKNRKPIPLNRKPMWIIAMKNACYNLTTVCKCFRVKRLLFKLNEDEVVRFKANVKLTRELNLKELIKND